MPEVRLESVTAALPFRRIVEEPVVIVTAPSRWSSTTKLPAPALTDWTRPSISSPAWPRGVMTALAPVIDAVIEFDPEARTTLPRAFRSARENSSATLPVGAPVRVKLPEESVWADWPDAVTRTVTPERGISIPIGLAPKVPLPRMTVPLTLAVPGEGGEESLWQETARASETTAQKPFATIRENFRDRSMGSSVLGFRRTPHYPRRTL